MTDLTLTPFQTHLLAVVKKHAPEGSKFNMDDLNGFYDAVRTDLEAGPWPNETMTMETGEPAQLIGGYKVIIAADADIGPDGGGGVVNVIVHFPSNVITGYTSNFGYTS